VTEPLVPPDVDLRDFAFMPLDVQRLRRSSTWRRAKKDPSLAYYLINLWTAAWHEVPAASIEDDDDVLAELAGCDPRKWKAVRSIVLAGWVKCSDGRLYHPVVAEKAIEAWGKKRVQRQKGQAGARARWGESKQSGSNSTSSPISSDTGNAPANATSKGTSTARAMPVDGKGIDRDRSISPAAGISAREADLSTEKSAAAAFSLIFPEKFSNAERESAVHILADCPQAQLLLDELEGLLQRNGVRDPMAMLLTLIGQQREGRFVASHAYRVQAEREGRTASAEVRAAQGAGRL